MPNYVRNIIKMEGIVNLPLFSERDGEKQFDFNKIIPMPPALLVEQGSMTDEAIVYYLTERCSIPISTLDQARATLLNTLVRGVAINNWPEEVFRRNCEKMASADESEREALYNAGCQYISNYEKYGATTWYSWSIRNWGTKWNACETEVIDDDTIIFETAWSSPMPILRKLVELYPQFRIELWWADEDVAQNTGHYLYQSSKERLECFSGDRDAYALYTKCWGECDWVYIDEEGNLQYREDDNSDGSNPAPDTEAQS